MSEYAIKQGDPLVVLGTLQEVDERTARIHYLSREAADLQRYEQLEAMGMGVSEMPAAGSADASFESSPRCVLAAAEDRSQPIVLSSDTPQRMIESLERSSTRRIWGGPILATLSFALLLRWWGFW